jgi:hypothetical protein
MAHSFNAHAPGKRGMERRCWLGPSQNWELNEWARGRDGHKIAAEQERKRATGATATAKKKTKGNGVNTASGCPIYRGSIESICCGSFHRTKCLNGSILRNSRED